MRRFMLICENEFEMRLIKSNELRSFIKEKSGVTISITNATKKVTI